jgi:hypothetical protein
MTQAGSVDFAVVDFATGFRAAGDFAFLDARTGFFATSFMRGSVVVFAMTANIE